MSNKKYFIEDLYVAQLGMVTSTNTGKIFLNPKTYVFLVKNEKKENEFIDILSKKSYQIYTNASGVGNNCLNEDTLEPANQVFDHPAIMVINEKLIKFAINELNKPLCVSDFGRCYTKICKYNKITYREIFEHIRDFHGHNEDDKEDKISKNNKKSKDTTKAQKTEEKEM